MKSMPPQVEDYPGRRIRLTIAEPNLDFTEVKDLAKQKARETCADPMLLSWYKGETGEAYPNVQCGVREKPAWIIFAESRGGDLTIDVNDGQYVFIYLSL